MVAGRARRGKGRSDDDLFDRDPFILAMHRAIGPVGQARDDYEIFSALAERLGYRDAFTEGRSSDEWVRLQWENSRASLARRGVEAPDFETFWEQGYFRMPEPEAMQARFEDFRKDPQANPLETETGRIMISLASVRAEGLPPHAAWLGADEYLGGDLSGRYPLHLLTPQPVGRLHSQTGLSSASRTQRRDGYEVLRIHPEDARARRICDGDIVEIFNERGVCTAIAAVDARMRESVVLLPTGADYLGTAPRDEVSSQADRGSNPNVLTKDVGTSVLGQGCAAQSCQGSMSGLPKAPRHGASKGTHGAPA